METAEILRQTGRAEVHEEFTDRVSSQAERLREQFDAGRFEGRFRVGLELEGVAVDGDSRMTAAPAEVFGAVCERELGRHNVELNTPATAFDPTGIEDQVDALAGRVGRVRRGLEDSGCRFVTDGLWAIAPPTGTDQYLRATRERGGITVPANMSPKARYYALDADITATGPVELNVPGCRRAFPSILVESLATSMQIHLQTPFEVFSRYFNVALRTVGPVLALAVNAPVLPPDLYGTDGEPDREVVLDGTAELRVPVFESLNVGTPGKVRFPRDIDEPTDVLDRLVDDRRCAPHLQEWLDDGPRAGFTERHWELLHKQSTCWRWVRPVLGPEGPRIEYRPLPAQPCVADVIAFQVLVVGLVHGVVVSGHPLRKLPRVAAEESLYAAVENGLDADLRWLASNGEHTTDTDRIYTEVFDLARRGLTDRGLAADRIDRLLAPVERRWTTGTTPAAWKRRRVRDRLDAGTDISTAVDEMQREYRRRAAGADTFADWPG